MAELMLMEAQRAQHVRDVIRPALDAGQVVLTDRYADSTTAYQGAGRGLDKALVASLNRAATGGLEPDLTLLLDLPVEAGLRRARARNADGPGDKEGRFEAEAVAFHDRVRKTFRALARSAPRRFHVLRSDRPAEVIAAEVGELVEKRLAAPARRARNDRRGARS